MVYHYRKLLSDCNHPTTKADPRTSFHFRLRALDLKSFRWPRVGRGPLTVVVVDAMTMDRTDSSVSSTHEERIICLDSSSKLIGQFVGSQDRTRHVLVSSRRS
ncbi:hypothetical protein EVAR_28011_1 [Eumeta japonica]|uniref:Uncharacterized protein n=1 Tax=Eumeta variegata TaxID=151549 RepID=A0A4C1WES1_EUMVA|nr:hypothetical protein EVAR_28011_1 [Eumeta japonica]